VFIDVIKEVLKKNFDSVALNVSFIVFGKNTRVISSDRKVGQYAYEDGQVDPS